MTNYFGVPGNEEKVNTRTSKYVMFTNRRCCGCNTSRLIDMRRDSLSMRPLLLLIIQPHSVGDLHHHDPQAFHLHHRLS